MNITLTISQIQNLIEFIEFEFIDSIRDDEEIDNIDYIVDMMDVYKKLKETLTNSHLTEAVNSQRTDANLSGAVATQEHQNNGGLL